MKTNEKIRAALFDRHVKWNQTELVQNLIENNKDALEDYTNLYERKYSPNQVFVESWDLKHNGIQYEGSVKIYTVDNDQDLVIHMNIDGSNEKLAASVIRQIDGFVKAEGIELKDVSASDICDILGIEGTVFDDKEMMDYQEYEKSVNQWYLIDQTMADWMKEVGVLVYEQFNCYWWGRLGGNSEASDDHDFNLVANHLKILKGQENSWQLNYGGVKS